MTLCNEHKDCPACNVIKRINKADRLMLTHIRGSAFKFWGRVLDITLAEPGHECSLYCETPATLKMTEPDRTWWWWCGHCGDGGG